MRLPLLSAIGWLMLPGGAAFADGGPILPLSGVHAGMNCTGETVVQGTTISPFNVHVIDIVRDPPHGARILVSVSGPTVDSTGVAQGFSGSPVYCDDGTGTLRNAGAISEGIGEYGNKVALVTPIQQMLGEPVKPPSTASRLLVRTRPLLGPLTVGGLSPALLHLLKSAAQRAGRSVVAAPSGSTQSFPVQPLIPGTSVAVQYSTGAIAAGAIGTVTYRDGPTVYAFGHPLDGAGRRSLILQDAYVYYVVNNPNVDLTTSYKLAAPGHTLGTLTSDTPNAVVGRVGPPPALVPIDVTTHDLDTGATLALHSQVADETDVGLPLGSSLVDLVTPLAITQASTDIYNGAPANESGRMCLEVTIRESKRPLSFCNRYVTSGVPGGGGLVPPALALTTSNDAATALGLIDRVQFAALHVTRVAARIDAERGLRQATIVAARARSRVKSGQAVRVHVLMRVFKGQLRTVAFEVRLPRPVHGRLVARIGNQTSPGAPGAGAPALAAALTVALGGSGGGAGSPPRSIAALRRAFSSIANYDGLNVSFGRRRPEHAYRDPALLITGQAKLVFQVAR